MNIARKTDIINILGKNPNLLSSGEQQKVAISAALTMNADLLLIDEPLSFLDNNAANDILKLIKDFHSTGKTIILAIHDLEKVASLADGIILLNEGEFVASGSPIDILYSKESERLIGRPLLFDIATSLIEQRIIEKPILEWNDIGRLIPKKKSTDNRSKRDTPIRAIDTVIEFRDVSFAYEDTGTTLSSINIKIQRGEIFGIVGPSGSGKTTLCKLLMGLLKPKKGTIFVNDRSIVNLKTHNLARYIGYVFQNPTDMLFAQSVEEECSFGPTVMNLPDAENRASLVLDCLGLSSIRERHPYSLSGGQQRLLTIAAVLSSNPDIVVLDEPQFGLDMKT